MTENRYEKHCPCTVSELREFRKLGEIEGTILEEAAAAKETLERNQWILTAEKSGLLRLAGMMGFFGAEQMETEELREEILSRWCSRSPYTYFHYDVSKKMKKEMKYNIIVAYEKMEDWESAEVKLEEYLESYPNDKAAKKEAEFLETR